MIILCKYVQKLRGVCTESHWSQSFCLWWLKMMKSSHRSEANDISTCGWRATWACADQQASPPASVCRNFEARISVPPSWRFSFSPDFVEAWTQMTSIASAPLFVGRPSGMSFSKATLTCRCGTSLHFLSSPDFAALGPPGWRSLEGILDFELLPCKSRHQVCGSWAPWTAS